VSILSNFKNKSVFDLFWSFSDNMIQQIINFVVGIVLARILTPAEFGLIGIITVFIFISNVFVDAGFSLALINKSSPSEKDYNTVFYFNLLISITIYIGLFFSADFIADFFSNQEISRLLKVTGLNLILIAFSVIHRTILVKKMNFKLITIISFISAIISSIISILMAYNDYGVYSLVYRVLIGQLLTTVLFFVFAKWFPKMLFSYTSFKELFKYGFNLFLSNLLNTIQSNIYFVVIGKYFSPSLLGFYTRANMFKDLGSTNISSTIIRVSFSDLSKINDRDIREEKLLFYEKINHTVVLIFMLALYLFADVIVLNVLGEKWAASIDILKSLSVSGVFISLYNFNINYLAVIKKTKSYLFVEILAKFLTIPVAIAGITMGFEVFIYLIVVHSIIMFFVSVFTLVKHEIPKTFITKEVYNTIHFMLILIMFYVVSLFLNKYNFSILTILFIKIVLYISVCFFFLY
jgi:O-antigen/teichoic acid export membrane protein